MESDTIKQLRDGYDAFNRGDFETVLRNFAPDFEGHDREEIPDPAHTVGLQTRARCEALQAFTR